MQVKRGVKVLRTIEARAEKAECAWGGRERWSDGRLHGRIVTARMTFFIIHSRLDWNSDRMVQSPSQPGQGEHMIPPLGKQMQRDRD